MGKNFLSKVFTILFILVILFQTVADAKKSYSSLFIKLSDAQTALKSNKKDEAEKLFLAIKEEFKNTENSASTKGKEVTKVLEDNSEINLEKLNSLSKALLEFEKEQNPVDDNAEKNNFKTKVLPALNKLESVIKSKDVNNMKEEYLKFNSVWLRNESVIRSRDITYYGKIETAMSFLRSSMEVEQASQENIENSFDDLKNAINDFLLGKKVEKSVTVTTLSEGVELLKKSYESFVNGDKKDGSLKMKKFIEAWPIIEGEVRTRDASLYTEVESKTPIIMVKGSEKKYQDELKDLISKLSKINTNAEYTFFDAMLILLREGLEALLIVLALASTIRATKQKKGLKWVYSGALLGIICSIVLAIILQQFFPTITGASQREIIEGVVGIFAVTMMIGIGIWLHSKSSQKAWQDYMNKKLDVIISTGSFISMFTLSFLAVFREGAETILFYVGILPRISINSLLLGIALAVLVLIIVAIVMLKLSVKIPVHKVFFILTWLIYLLAFKMLGVSIHALQLTNVIPANLITYIPTIDLIGIYPSTQVMGSQMIFVLIIFIVMYIKRDKKN